MIKINDTDISGVYVGSSAATAIYLGSQQIWSSHNYANDYFTLKALESSTFSWAVDNVEYSLNDGTWTTWDSATTLSVVADDKIRFRSSTNTSYNGLTISSTGRFDVEGNSMSLFYGDNFIDKTTFPGASYNFQNLFNGNTYLVNAENLILPAISLTAWGTYQSMFEGCTSLTKAPELPATTMGSGSYQSMFKGCTSLIKAPSILPTTTFGSKFSCYESMFYGCTSLVNAPELPATTLKSSCYANMFNGCSNLNYVKCLATDISASRCTANWLNGVSATGTFVKDANMVDWATGASGIPEGWTVQ